MEERGESGAGAPAIPDRIGSYRIVRRIGVGGMGEVYLAIRESPQQLVAVKVIKLGMDSERVLARFEVELQALALMDHTNIARMFDAGTTERGQPYFAMEYVPGVPITDYCAQRRLGVEARLSLFLRVCDGVQHAHQKGVIHRDLKPGNILVAEQDDRPVPKIIDFGLARAVDPLRLRTGASMDHRVVGTLAYMSPEQAQPDALDIDTRADVYSLGVVLYELLAGEPPFPNALLERLGQFEMLRMIREEEPATPSRRLSTASDSAHSLAHAIGAEPGILARRVRGDLDAITLCALEKDRNRRYKSVSALAANIERHLRHEPVHPQPPGATYRLTKWAKRHRRGVWTSVGALVAVLGLAGVWVWKQLETERVQHLAILAADPAVLRELKRRADEELWPAREPVVPAMERWLSDADAYLSRLPEHERESASDEQRARLVESTRAFATVTVPVVRSRLERARTFEQRSLVAHADAWRRVANAVREEPYGIAELSPQPGLVPLGEGPAGLQEFWVLDSGEPPSERRDGHWVVGDDTAILVVLIPGGTFTMGAQATDPAGPNHDPDADPGVGPPIEVTLDPFFLGKHELTQAQWLRLAELTPEDNSANHRPSSETPFTLVHPVELVSWSECDELLRRCGMRLPTSAQWEYACRAGTTSRYHTGDDSLSLDGYANLLDQSRDRETPVLYRELVAPFDDAFVWTAPVGSMRPNAFGLFDVHGNVFEWCLDGYVLGYAGGVEDGNGLLVGSTWTGRGMYRGGSFSVAPRSARCAEWRQAAKSNRYDDVGVRVAMALRR